MTGTDFYVNDCKCRDISEFKMSETTFDDEMFDTNRQEIIAIDLIKR